MARIKKDSKTYGIKELKDQASEIIQRVVKTGRPVVISKNNKEVAQIIPIRRDPMQMFLDLGLVHSSPAESWSTLNLHKIGVKATVAIKTILEDRG